MKRTEFALRMLLIYVAGILSAIGEDGAITAPFAVASMFLTAELASRAANRSAVDRITRIAGSIIVALVLGGLVLNLLPEGLTRKSWAALWVVISLAVLWWKRSHATSFRWLQAKPTSQTAWFGASAVVVVMAFVVATVGANNELSRPLQMWVQGTSPGAIAVAVSSGSEAGPYRLVVDPEVTKTDAFDPFTVSPNRSVERSLPAAGSTRYNIYLVDVKSGEKVRTVIVESPPI